MRNAVNSRARRARGVVRRGLEEPRRWVKATVRRAPIPQPLRSRLYATLPWRPGVQLVPIDKILLGLQNRVPADVFAEQHGDLLWPSTPVSEGPHAQLLTLAEQCGGPTDEAILASPYGTLARRCISTRGFFFNAVDEAGIVAVARDYIARHRGEPAGDLGEHQTLMDQPIRLAPIRWSDCYQVIDGHHRIASAAARGDDAVPARIKWMPVVTPLQSTLNKMSWLEGEHLLYQPVDSPELLQSWTTVRSCRDRLTAMLDFLKDHGLMPPATATYLDVASCYGWFVSQMAGAGFAAEGVERDPLAGPLGEAVYGLQPGQVEIGDAVDFLSAPTRQWDVVSCFSLLHHFVLGRGPVSAGELTRLLDKATGRVLFLDTGQDDEDWFSESLAGWTPARVRAFLQSETTFDEIIDLGPDSDRVPPFERNYGRHLFACLRTTTA